MSTISQTLSTSQRILKALPAKDKDPGFTIFKDLPTEVRLMIWEKCLPDPRLVELRRRRAKRRIADLQGVHDIADYILQELICDDRDFVWMRESRFWELYSDCIPS